MAALRLALHSCTTLPTQRSCMPTNGAAASNSAYASTRAHGPHASHARRAAARATAALSRRRCHLPRGDRASARRCRGRRPACHRHRSRRSHPCRHHDTRRNQVVQVERPLATQHIGIRVGAGAKLDWLPQNNIVFESSNVELEFTLTLDDGATAIGWDAMQLGRQAAGERWSSGTLCGGVAHRRRSDGRLRWFERASLAADDPLRDAPQGLAGFAAYGTLWALGAACNDALAETLTAQTPVRRHPARRRFLRRAGRADRARGGRSMEPLQRALTDCWTATASAGSRRRSGAAADLDHVSDRAGASTKAALYCAPEFVRVSIRREAAECPCSAGCIRVMARVSLKMIRLRSRADQKTRTTHNRIIDEPHAFPRAPHGARRAAARRAPLRPRTARRSRRRTRHHREERHAARRRAGRLSAVRLGRRRHEAARLRHRHGRAAREVDGREARTRAGQQREPHSVPDDEQGRPRDLVARQDARAREGASTSRRPTRRTSRACSAPPTSR